MKNQAEIPDPDATLHTSPPIALAAIGYYVVDNRNTAWAQQAREQRK
jgi:hypothetical protein